MKNLVLGLIYLSFTFQITDAAIRPVDKTYEVEQNEPLTIEWVYDNQDVMLVVTWTFKNSTAETAEIVMTQIYGAVAQPEASIDNIQHEQNGTITLKKVGLEDIGTYKCFVTYAGYSPVTGTATIKLKATPAATTSGGFKWWKILLIVLGIILGLFLAGIILGCFLKANSDLFYNCKSDCCDECFSKICPCCKGLPTWFKILGFTGIGTPVALGMLLVWKCCKGLPGRESDNGATQMRRMNQKVSRSFRTWTSWQNAEEKPSTVKDNKKLLDNMDFNDITDNGDTWNDNVDTRSSPKKDKIRSLDNKTQSKSPGKAEGVNKEKPAVVKQNQHADQADKKHLESEEKKPSRSRILPPVGTNHSRERSDSVVSGQNVELQETETSLKRREGTGSVVSRQDVEMHETDTSLNRSQLPNIPGHDKKGRGLSANFGDDDHPLVAIDIPAQNAGALPTITDTPREDKKKAKKKKKDKQEDNQNTETVLNF